MSNEREQFKDFILAVLRGTAFTVHQKIVQRTPIDTGRARTSWNLSENTPDLSVTPALRTTYHSVTGAVIELAAPGAAPLTPQQALVTALAQQQNIGESARVICITNNLPYIGRLEDGSSSQAPSGMVARTIIPDALKVIVAEQVAKYRI